MGELSDGASEDNCMIYDLRLQIGVHAFLAGRYRALKSEIFILKSVVSQRFTNVGL